MPYYPYNAFLHACSPFLCTTVHVFLNKKPAFGYFCPTGHSPDKSVENLEFFLTLLEKLTSWPYMLFLVQLVCPPDLASP